MTTNQLHIGIDFGGVLSKLDIADENGHRNTQIDMPDSIEILRKLKNEGHKLFLISFCGKSRAVETSQSIKNSEISDIFEKEFYVKKPEYKSIICNLIGCDIMIDDTLEVIDNIKLNCKNTKCIHFNNDNNWKRIYELISHIKTANNPITNININELKKYLYLQ